MKELLKDKKAITLIALVITIVVLVILAVVTISLTVGNDGLISRAIKAAKGYNAAQEKDKQSINDLYGQLSIATDGTISGLTVTQLEQIIDSKTQPLEATISELNTEITNIKNSLTTQDITSSLHLNDTYVSARGTVALTKSGNTITLTAYMNQLADIPNNTTIITIDEPYRPKKRICRKLGYKW